MSNITLPTYGDVEFIYAVFNTEEENSISFVRQDRAISVADWREDWVVVQEAIENESLFVRPIQPPNHTWVDGEWVLSNNDLLRMIDEALSAERDKALDVDVTIPLTDSREIVLKNNERTKINIAFKLNTLAADVSMTHLAYECRNGWFDLSYGDFQESSYALDMFTQGIFDKLRLVYDANHTSVEDAVNDFKARLEDV